MGRCPARFAVGLGLSLIHREMHRVGGVSRLPIADA